MQEKLIEKALQYLQSAEAFASKEVPAYIQELVEFKIFEHLVYYFNDFLITIPLAILGVYGYRKVSKWLNGLDKKSHTYDSNNGSQYILLFLIIPLVISVIGTGHLVQAYKAYKAPRVYLVEYFTNKDK